MAIELQEQTQAQSYPVVKRQAIGEITNLAIIRTEQRERKNAKGEQIMNSRGRPAQELIIHGLVLPGTTAHAGLGDSQSVPNPGDRVRVILKGGGYGQFLDARKTHRNGKLCVGDVFIQRIDWAQAYDQGGAPQGQRITDGQQVVQLRMRGQTVGHYGPIWLQESSDPTWVQMAEAEYQSDEDRKRIALDDDQQPAYQAPAYHAPPAPAPRPPVDAPSADPAPAMTPPSAPPAWNAPAAPVPSVPEMPF